MKILFVHNKYGKTSGEEISIIKLMTLLQDNGHQTLEYFRSSEEIKDTPISYLNTFFSNFFNYKSYRDLKRIILNEKPDIVQFQNLYPFISPLVLKYIKKLNIPIVLRAPNYRLFCPNGLFMQTNGLICEKCAGSGKEIWSVYHNCESNIVKSSVYALRNLFARKTKSILGNVDLFLVQSNFQKSKFVKYGVQSNKIAILPGFIPKKKVKSDFRMGDYILYIGRFSFEKGTDDFISLARMRPDLKFAIAGKIDENIKRDIPENIICFGFLNNEEMDSLINQSLALIVPSKCYEGFPNVIVQAMSMKLPIIAAKIGVLSEIITNRLNGLHFEAGNIQDLNTQLNYLLLNPIESMKMAEESFRHYLRKYNDDVVHQKLMEFYNKVLLP